MTMRTMRSMLTSQVSVELARACLGPLVVSVAAGEGVGDLVPGVLHRALGLLDAPFVSAVDQQAVNGPEEPHRAARDAGEL